MLSMFLETEVLANASRFKAPDFCTQAVKFLSKILKNSHFLSCSKRTFRTSRRQPGTLLSFERLQVGRRHINKL